MAGRNTFAALKDYATKEVKFKQTVHIDTARQLYGLQGTHWDKIAKGMCATLTMLWLQEKLGKGTEGTSFDRGAGVWSSEHQDNALLIMAKAEDYRQYERDETTVGVDRAIENLAARHDLRVAGLLAEGSRTEVFAAIEAQLPHRCGVFVEARFSKGYSHAVGVCCLGSRLFFFDPNIGGYRLDNDGDDIFEGFGITWESVLDNAYNRDLKECAAFVVV